MLQTQHPVVATGTSESLSPGPDLTGSQLTATSLSHVRNDETAINARLTTHCRGGIENASAKLAENIPGG